MARGWSPAALLLCLAAFQPLSTLAQELEFSLGLYGPWTSRDMRFAATGVLFDLDFRKNFNSTLVDRFGPPIVNIPNLHPDLRIKLQLCDSASDTEIGMRCALNLFQGQNGYSPVAGLVGGQHSAISMPVTSMGTLFKVPQISYGSTSPKLSAKAAYPYFLRTIPPDVIQGQAMWQFVTHFRVPSVTFLYTQEAYGEGLFQAVVDKASSVQESFRIAGVGVVYMPGAGNYRTDEAATKITLAKRLGSKMLMVGMTSDQAMSFLGVANDQGLFSGAYQMLASESISAASAPVPLGFMNFAPVNQGPLYPLFEDMWKKMEVDDVTGPDAVAQYKLDKSEVPFSRAVLPLTNVTFLTTNTIPLFMSFLFDACYCFVFAANELLQEGVALVNVSKQALLAKVQHLRFEGISGTVAFDANGDRQASYDLINLQADGVARIPARFSAIAGQITNSPSMELYWMSGTAGWSIPDVFASCEPGFWKDSVGANATLMCIACDPGTISEGGTATTCQACPAGQRANVPRGATSCVPCLAGTYSAESKSTQCMSCTVGEFVGTQKATACKMCTVGEYTNATASTACIRCSEGKPRPELYATLHQVSIAGVAEWVVFEGAADVGACGCKSGAYQLADGTCDLCGLGMICPGMGEVYLERGYFSTKADPGSVFECFGQSSRCPGGLPDTCAPGRKVDSVACTACQEGLKPGKSGECEECHGNDAVPLIIGVLVAATILLGMYRAVDSSQPGVQSKSLLLVTLAGSQMVTTLQHLGVFSSIPLNWQPPFNTMLHVMALASLKLDYFSVDCISRASSLQLFAVRIFLVIAFFLALCLIHVISVCLFHGRRFRAKMPALIGSVGTIFSAFFISIVTSMLAPFQCDTHPNSMRTVRDYPTVICWGSHEHDEGGHPAMVALGLVASLIPLTFFVGVCAVVWMLPEKLAKGNTEFLHSFRFLFFRFRHGAHYYIVIFLLRNMVISIIPAIGQNVVQLMVLILVMLPMLVLTVYLAPWSIVSANWLDAANTMSLIILLYVFALFTEGVDPALMSQLCVVIVSVVLLSVVLAVMWGLYERFLRSGKPYQFFISHHKAGAGNFARLLKMSFLERSQVGRQVFVDSDNLRDLADLFGVVSSDTETLVVLCSPDFLLRPWCVGEVCTAFSNKVNVHNVLFPGFMWPTETFIDSYEQHAPDALLLSKHGISLDLVKTSLRWLRLNRCAVLASEANASMLNNLTTELVLAQKRSRSGRTSEVGQTTISANAPEKQANSDQASFTKFIIVNSANSESACAALVLQKLLLPLAERPTDIPQVLGLDDHILPRSARQLCLICDGVVFNSVLVVGLLMQAAEKDVAVLPVVSDASFRFPTASYLRQLSRQSGELLKQSGSAYTGGLFARVVSRVFKEIAVQFNPQDAESALFVRAQAISHRLSGGLRTLGIDVKAPHDLDDDWEDEELDDIETHFLPLTDAGLLHDTMNGGPMLGRNTDVQRVRV